MDFCAIVCTILVLIWGAIGLCTSDQDNGRAQYNLFLSLSHIKENNTNHFRCMFDLCLKNTLQIFVGPNYMKTIK